jgi:two-component system response regulator NreC
VRTRILIADDHVVVRSGLRALLELDPELEVVGEAGNGEETMSLAEELRPDLVLLDIGMPGENGIEVTKRLKAALPQVVVLLLTMHEDESLLHEGLRAGAAGYVIKRAEESEIVQAIRVVTRGGVYVHPAMTRALLHQPATTQPRREPTHEKLTRREADVLRLLARGNTNRQIADVLGISVRTVENHRANLMGKLALSSRVELVTYVEEHDLL